MNPFLSGEKRESSLHYDDSNPVENKMFASSEGVDKSMLVRESGTGSDGFGSPPTLSQRPQSQQFRSSFRGGMTGQNFGRKGNGRDDVSMSHSAGISDETSFSHNDKSAWGGSFRNSHAPSSTSTYPGGVDSSAYVDSKSIPDGADIVQSTRKPGRGNMNNNTVIRRVNQNNSRSDMIEEGGDQIKSSDKVAHGMSEFRGRKGGKYGRGGRFNSFNSRTNDSSSIQKRDSLQNDQFGDGRDMDGAINSKGNRAMKSDGGVATGGPLFSCRVCHASFSSKSEMYAHLENEKHFSTAGGAPGNNVSSVPRGHVCQKCGDSFASRSKLRSHLIEFQHFNTNNNSHAKSEPADIKSTQKSQQNLEDGSNTRHKVWTSPASPEIEPIRKSPEVEEGPRDKSESPQPALVKKKKKKNNNNNNSKLGDVPKSSPAPKAEVTMKKPSIRPDGTIRKEFRERKPGTCCITGLYMYYYTFMQVIFLKKKCQPMCLHICEQLQRKSPSPHENSLKNQVHHCLILW